MLSLSRSRSALVALVVGAALAVPSYAAASSGQTAAQTTTVAHAAKSKKKTSTKKVKTHSS